MWYDIVRKRTCRHETEIRSFAPNQDAVGSMIRSLQSAAAQSAAAILFIDNEAAVAIGALASLLAMGGGAMRMGR
jgi:hypothetical protein